ncbi:conserved hypothetical protein [Neospora caninum Liverpool]|uniref:ADF-H domain-containing protein n=1 Tax=Neospora caninum (strain Liverpool) TaxID=572307 RepID=F0VFU1_NEOCL|nr:conserved hypothetical protein [Neospora caninum Liverpool]CBZ52585.1 conserved hypothetical protein [Neospora caninum Liverpool]CEL66563.1 TPA: hypothetical protein BN1204_023740 [Neospora caninum Liverpool]|eukprot:XP_003882617.1 conserved hypothetical protein [Neospora caninum Liverpool]
MPSPSDQEPESPSLAKGASLDAGPPASEGTTRQRVRPHPPAVSFAEPVSFGPAPSSQASKASTQSGSSSSFSSSGSSHHAAPADGGEATPARPGDFFPKRKEQVKDTIFCSHGEEDDEDRADQGQSSTTKRPPRVVLEEALEEKLATLASSACLDELVAISFNEKTCSLSLVEAFPFEGGSLHARFERLGKLACPDSPRIFLLRLDVESNSPEWAVISWTPAAVCSPCRRTFVDFAAWSLRSSLRFSRPVKEYYAGKPALLDLEAFRRAQRQVCRVHVRRSRVEDAFLAEDHIRVPRLSTLETDPEGSPVPPDIPLEVDESFSERLEEFRKGEVACLEIFIDDEDSTLFALPCIHDTPALLQQHVTDGRPRYFLLRYEDKDVFIFFCIDSDNRRDCVLYAACKHRVWNLFLKFGVQVSRRYEIRSAAEVSRVLNGTGTLDSPVASQSFSSDSAAGSRSMFVGTGEHPAELAKENGLVLLAMLPAKAPPPGDGWMQTDIIPAAQDTLEAWQECAGLPNNVENAE